MFEERKTIRLTRSYTVHDVTFDSVTLRAPKLKDILVIGTPVEWQPVQKGDMMYVEYLDRIDAYVERLAETPRYDALQDLALPDALQIKRAITDFFTAAEATLSNYLISLSSAKGAGSAKLEI